MIIIVGVIVMRVSLPGVDFSEPLMDVIGFTFQLDIWLSTSTKSDHGVHEQKDLDAYYQLFTVDF